jgi:hypothetical protein
VFVTTVKEPVTQPFVEEKPIRGDEAARSEGDELGRSEGGGAACSIDSDSATSTSKGKHCFFLILLRLIDLLNK